MTKNEFEKLIDRTNYQVFFFNCPAFFPVNFASHPWFILNNKGEISRWEILFETELCKTSWGHLHKNYTEPYNGVGMFPYFDKFKWKANLKGIVEGETAKKMIEYIEDSKENYPFCYKYRLTPGPNSNTYAQMILDHFPEASFKLTANAVGKKYKEN